MKYMLIGVKMNPVTQDVMSTIEYVFNSYTEARMQQIVMEKLYPDMKFHVNFNNNFVSIDTMLTYVDKDSIHIPSNFN